jgi:hypothetical protein
MRKYFLIFILISIAAPSFGQCNSSKIFNSKYCFSNNDHSLTVIFKVKGDVVYMYYLDISGNGNYINGFDDSTDYAAKFLIRDFKESGIMMSIKSYRDTMTCNLILSYNAKKGWLYWNLSRNPYLIGYLARHATLKKCNE